MATTVVKDTNANDDSDVILDNYIVSTQTLSYHLLT